MIAQREKMLIAMKCKICWLNQWSTIALISEILNVIYFNIGYSLNLSNKQKDVKLISEMYNQNFKGPTRLGYGMPLPSLEGCPPTL